MFLFIDCEFNQFKGQLLSMGITTEDGQLEFYEVLKVTETIQPWVAENVMPILEKDPIDYVIFQSKLKAYLQQFPAVTVVCNHPDDIKYFSEAMITDSSGGWFKFETIGMLVDDRLSSKKSKVLHNAIWDARAMRDDYLQKQGLA